MIEQDVLELRVEDDPAHADVATLDEQLAAFTAAASGHGPPEPLAVFARHEGMVAAGIHGWTWGECCELVSLWVNEPRRGRELGSALLAAAEKAALQRGCRQVVLFTHAFQAPHLYTTSGYELVGEVDDYPKGSAALWFRKRLDPSPTRPLLPPRVPLVLAARSSHFLRVALYVGIAMMLAAELADDLRTLSRRTSRLLADTVTRFERQERRNARHTEMAVLASHLGRPSQRKRSDRSP